MTAGTTSAADPAAVAEFKALQRQTWATGDYPAMATRIADVGRRLAGRLAVAPGERVLDIACGSGNFALPAARAGGRVTGIDLTPELLEAGARAAAGAGVEIHWQEGDAEDLPLEDGTFDVVGSTFGCMFAPRHEQAARELVRVLRPGGRFGVCAWTPEGTIGDFFRLVGSFVPPPPPFAGIPIAWGDEAHVRDLFAPLGVTLEFEREIVDLRFPSVEAGVEEYAERFGPVIRARRLLEPQGRWPELRDALTEMFIAQNVATDGTLQDPAEYLVITGRRSG